MIAELLISELKRLMSTEQGRAWLTALSIAALIILIFSAGRLSVDTDPASICGPLNEALKRCTTQLKESERRATKETLEATDEGWLGAQEDCALRLADQLAKVKELRCRICEGKALEELSQ